MPWQFRPPASALPRPSNPVRASTSASSGVPNLDVQPKPRTIRQAPPRVQAPVSDEGYKIASRRPAVFAVSWWVTPTAPGGRQRVIRLRCSFIETAGLNARRAWRLWRGRRLGRQIGEQSGRRRSLAPALGRAWQGRMAGGVLNLPGNAWRQGELELIDPTNYPARNCDSSKSRAPDPCIEFAMSRAQRPKGVKGFVSATSSIFPTPR